MSGTASAAKDLMAGPSERPAGTPPVTSSGGFPAMSTPPARVQSSAAAYTVPTIRQETTRLAAGRYRDRFDRRLFDFIPGDVIAPVVSDFSVSKADRMTPEQAGERMGRLVAEHLAGATGVNMTTFVHALLFCHTLNGASVLTPGRAGFTIRSNNRSWRVEYLDVVKALGPDLRRFFRAYADVTRSVNQAVLNARDSGDWESVQRYSMLEQVAAWRKMARYPDLAHDSADACSSLTTPERNALMASTKIVVEGTENTVDTL